MSCKSALYGANTAAQTLALNDVINMGSVVRRFGCNANMSGGNAVVRGLGYYDIDTNITYEADGAGIATITLYKDGVEIPGANASQSVVADTTYSFNISCLVRQVCECEAVITAIITGVAGTVSNAAINVEKI